MTLGAPWPSRFDLAVDWGKMHSFTMEMRDDSKRRYRAYNREMVPLTALLRPVPFCLWALLTQQSQMDHLDYLGLTRTLDAAGLGQAVDRAMTLISMYIPSEPEPEPLV
jgi:hypothetical protein